MKEQIIVIILIPMIVVVYTVSTVVSYFKMGRELGLKLSTLLSIKMLTNLVVKYIKGYKIINEQMDSMF